MQTQKPRGKFVLITITSVAATIGALVGMSSFQMKSDIADAITGAERDLATSTIVSETLDMDLQLMLSGVAEYRSLITEQRAALASTEGFIE